MALLTLFPPHGWFLLSRFPTSRFCGWNSRSNFPGSLIFVFRFLIIYVPFGFWGDWLFAIIPSLGLALLSMGSGFLLTLKGKRINLIKHWCLIPYRVLSVPLDTVERVKIGFYSHKPDSNWLGLREIIELLEFSQSDSYTAKDPESFFGSPRTLTPLGHAIKEEIARHLEELKNSQPLKDRELLKSLRLGKALPDIAAMVAEGASPLAETLFGRSTLHYAAQFYNYPDIFAYLFEKTSEKSVLNRQDHFGESPLFLAIKMEKAGVVSYLLKYAVDLSLKNLNRQNILHLAAQSPATEMKHLFNRLISQDQIREKDIRGNLPLHYAAGVGGPGTREVIFSLASDRALVNEKNLDGRTPLHFAAKIGSDENIRTLIALGADPTVRDKEGNLAGEITSVLRAGAFSSEPQSF
jgi:ankyrin repeat protein